MPHNVVVVVDNYHLSVVLQADRRCSKCDHEGMIYTTRQTRSADEGQTVFFTCPECRSVTGAFVRAKNVA